MYAIYRPVKEDLCDLVKKADANNRQIKLIVLLQSEWDSLVKSGSVESDSLVKMSNYFMGVKLKVLDYV